MSSERPIPFSEQIKGPYPVEFLQSLAATDCAFKPGDRISVSQFYRDAWTAAGIVRPVDSLITDDPDTLRKQIAELQDRLKAVDKKR